MMRICGSLGLLITISSGFDSETLLNNYCTPYPWRRCTKRPMCEWIPDPAFDGRARDAPGTCEPKSQDEICGDYTPELSQQKKCGERTFGSCIFDYDKMNCEKRDMSDSCQPCVGSDQALCGASLKSKKCKADTDEYHCDWIGWRNGYKCQEDWLACSDSSLQFENKCNEQTWGRCKWSEFNQACEENTTHQECEPCRGPGSCTAILTKKTCESQWGQRQGCEWRGWKHGDFCSDKDYGYRCWSVGDPHVHPFEPALDKFDFMGIGDFWLVDSPAFQIQVRQQETQRSTATSNLAVAWFGPEYPCNQGKDVCSNTCGYTYELYPGHRVQPRRKDQVLGDAEYEPLLVINNVEGGSPAYWTFTGMDAITAELTNGRCDQMTGEHVSESHDGDALALRFTDNSQIRLSRWNHPEWGIAIYLFLRDRGIYDYFNPPASGYKDALCNVKCNPVSCSENFFTLFPDPQYKSDADWANRYAGISTPYADFRSKLGWCEEFEDISTQCEERPDPSAECPEEILNQATTICNAACEDEETVRSCIFDACVAEDITYADEYVETCQTIITPVEVPVPPPTYEPTPSPTNVDCAAVFSPVCQQNGEVCGTQGGIINGLKRYTSEPMFTLLMEVDHEGTNPCSCEQFCMIKGGKWWEFTNPKPAPTVYRHQKIHYWQRVGKGNPRLTIDGDKCTRKIMPASYGLCECWWEKDASSVTTSGKQVEKNQKKYRKGEKTAMWAGEVNAFHIPL